MQPIKCIVVAGRNKNVMHVERKKSINKISATSDTCTVTIVMFRIISARLMEHARLSWWTFTKTFTFIKMENRVNQRFENLDPAAEKHPGEAEATVWHTAARSLQVFAGAAWTESEIKICCSLNRNEPQSWGIVALQPLILFFLFLQTQVVCCESNGFESLLWVPSPAVPSQAKREWFRFDYKIVLKQSLNSSWAVFFLLLLLRSDNRTGSHGRFIQRRHKQRSTYP